MNREAFLNRVAVTGIGVVSALGLDSMSFWDALCKGTSGFTLLEQPKARPYRFELGAQIVDFAEANYFDGKDVKFLDRFCQFAAVAAREAIAQSGLSFDGELRNRTAVITGSSLGGKLTEEEFYSSLFRHDIHRASPLSIPRAMANSGASRISYEHGIQGPCYTVSTACSSATHAIGQAFAMVRSGSVIAAVAGGSEAVFTEGVLRAWDALRVVSSDTCRPFSIDRSGLLLGEGGSIIMLENWDHARSRGARILGELCGFGMSSDAHHLTQPSVEGPAKAISWALQDASITPEAVQYINAHGTGTKVNDATETAAIRKVFGDHTHSLLVSSTKSMHGHALGASGAIEAAATLLALKTGIIPPTGNYTAVDPDCDIDVVPSIARIASVEYAVSNSFAFGGLNAVLVFRQPTI